MDQYLQSLEKMKDMPIVRFFSQFFTQSKLSPLIAHFRAGLAVKTPGALAQELFVWAVVLAVGTFAIDQIFYWTNPGQAERARDTWQSVSSGFSSFGRGVTGLIVRTRNAFEGRREAARGRR